MAETKKGFVAKVFKKEGTSKRGPWFAVSFKLADESGNEDPMFFQLGFNKESPFKEGDYIQFDAEPKDDRAMTVGIKKHAKHKLVASLTHSHS